MNDLTKERLLLKRLSWLLEKNLSGPEIYTAREELRAFYRSRGMWGSESYFRFDDETKSLVPFEPAPSLRVRQDG